MRSASRLLWPWLVIGSPPPVESILISDQMIPVWICTEATCEIAILSSVLLNHRGFTRLTCSGLTTMRVGKIRFPRVQRLAANVSLAAGICESVVLMLYSHIYYGPHGFG